MVRKNRGGRRKGAGWSSYSGSTTKGQHAHHGGGIVDQGGGTPRGRTVQRKDRLRAAPKTIDEWTRVGGVVMADLLVIAGHTYEGSLHKVMDRIIQRKGLNTSSTSIGKRLQAGGWLGFERQDGSTVWDISDRPVDRDDMARADYLVRQEGRGRQPKRDVEGPKAEEYELDEGQTTGIMQAVIGRPIKEEASVGTPPNQRAVKAARQGEQRLESALGRATPPSPPISLVDQHAECDQKIESLEREMSEQGLRLIDIETERDELARWKKQHRCGTDGDLAASNQRMSDQLRELDARLQAKERKVQALGRELDEASALSRALMDDPATAGLIRAALRLRGGATPDPTT